MPYHSRHSLPSLSSPCLDLLWHCTAFFSILHQFISFYSQLYVTYVLCFCIIFYSYSHSSRRLERTVLFDCTEGKNDFTHQARPHQRQLVALSCWCLCRCGVFSVYDARRIAVALASRTSSHKKISSTDSNNDA